jgi:hypothetical protein
MTLAMAQRLGDTTAQRRAGRHLRAIRRLKAQGAERRAYRLPITDYRLPITPCNPVKLSGYQLIDYRLPITEYLYFKK